MRLQGELPLPIRSLLNPTNNLAAQLVRYGFVGLTAFVFDFAILVALTESGLLHYTLAAAVAFLAGLSTNYALSVRWVFASRNVQEPGVEFTLFAVIGVAGLGLTELIMWFGTESVGWDYRLSKMLAVIAVLAWNFGMRKALLFRNAPSSPRTNDANCSRLNRIQEAD